MYPKHQLALPVCLRSLQPNNLKLLSCLHETVPRNAITFAVPVALRYSVPEPLCRRLMFQPDWLLSSPPSLSESPRQLKLGSGANASGCVMDRHSVHQRLYRICANGFVDFQPCWITVCISGASQEKSSLTYARITWGIEMTCTPLRFHLPRSSKVRA